MFSARHMHTFSLFRSIHLIHGMGCVSGLARELCAPTLEPRHPLHCLPHSVTEPPYIESRARRESSRTNNFAQVEFDRIQLNLIQKKFKRVKLNSPSGGRGSLWSGCKRRRSWVCSLRSFRGPFSNCSNSVCRGKFACDVSGDGPRSRSCKLCVCVHHESNVPAELHNSFLFVESRVEMVDHLLNAGGKERFMGA